MLKLQYFDHLMQKLTHLKRPWCWERLKAGREEAKRRWGGYMASLTQWIWVWASSRNWWWTGKPGVLQSMGSQRVGHNWVTEVNWTWRKEECKRYSHQGYESLSLMEAGLDLLTPEYRTQVIGCTGGSSTPSSSPYQTPHLTPRWVRLLAARVSQ